MMILACERSREPCEEAGWIAYDYTLDTAMEKEQIIRLRALGSLTYLASLRQPFYKVESAYLLVKGLQGDPSLRVGVHKDHIELLDTVCRALASADCQDILPKA